MTATNQIEAAIRAAMNAVVQQIAATHDEIAGAVVGRNTEVHLVMNNSFLSRSGQSVKTNQSSRRLVARLVAKGKHVSADEISIAEDLTGTKHYRLLFAAEKATLTPLNTAINQELVSIGDLLFILIGTIKGMRPHVQNVQSSVVKELHVGTSPGKDFEKVGSGLYAIRKLLPLEELLDHITQDLGQSASLTVEDRRAIAKAYDEVLDSVVTEVTVPTAKVTNPKNTILGQIVGSLDSHTDEYRSALETLQGAPDDRQTLNEILRIAYNFSTDVLPLISLFNSISDLKPLVFWCTVKEHWALARAFSSLPWSALGRKESLEEYQSVVSQARSYAFHHVLPFDSTVEIDLTTLDVRADSIRLFVPFGQKQGRGVHLKDQKLADILAEFSRAKQRPVSTAFWKANLNVMQAACYLAHQVLKMLALVHEAKHS